MNLNIITDFDEINTKEFSEFVFNHPKGNIFQTPEIYEVYENTKNYEPMLLVVFDDKNEILGTLLSVIQKEHSGLLGRFSSRAIIWGGPIIKDNDLEVLDFILNEYNKIAKRKAIYSQFRNMWEWKVEEKEVFKRNGYDFEDHLDIIHNLEKTDEEFFSQMHKGRRKNVRRAIKKKVDFKEIEPKEELMKSLSLIQDTYKKVKFPMPDDSLFVASYNELYSKHFVKFFKAFYNNKIIGVRFVFCYKELIYDWYAGSSGLDSDKYPNDFLPFKVMQWGRDNAYKVFQFGGAGKPNKPYGIRDYKLKFGGDLVNWGRFEIVHKPILMKMGKLGFIIYKKVKSVF